jgi:hypothetical protein
MLRSQLLEQRKMIKVLVVQCTEANTTFEGVAREWIEMKAQRWAPQHTERVTRSLEVDVFPMIGNIPVSQIESVLLRSAIDPIQKRGALDIAGRVRQRCSNVFDYAMAIGACSSNPAESLIAKAFSRKQLSS